MYEIYEVHGTYKEIQRYLNEYWNLFIFAPHKIGWLWE